MKLNSWFLVVSMLYGSSWAQANPQAATSAPATKTKFAQIEVKLDGKLAEKASVGIRTLYIILYNAQSAAPMPYGALKVDLDKDPKGSVFKGTLDSSNVMMMSGGPLPESLKIKARLDKDGSAGKDSPGDLVGLAEQVKLGSDVSIVIDKAI